MAENSIKAWLNSFLSPLRQTFKEIIALSVSINILALVLPIVTLQIYDRVISYNGFSTLQGLVIGAIIVVLFDFVLREGRSRVLQNAALRVDVYISQKLFSKFMSLPMKALEEQPSSHWLSLFKDADTIRRVLSGKSAILIADLPFTLFFLIMIFVIATPIAWVFLIILPFLLFFSWYAAFAAAQAHNAEQKTEQARSLLVLEIINARNTIKAMSLETVMEPLWEDVQAKNIEASVKQSTMNEKFSNANACLIALAFLFVIAVGALAIINQELTIGTLIATCMLSSLLLSPLSQFVSNLTTYHLFCFSVDRLGEFFNSVSERQVNSISMDKPSGKITLENIIFSYSHELPKVINNVTFTFKETGLYALVGPNGSGKSTLLRLIQGLYKPTSGRVLIDGSDISQFSRGELSAWIGLVPQDCMLFSGTVRDNIACRQSSISDDEVIRVAKAVGAHQFIVDMPDGYNTEIGEDGFRLSYGERQRVAIARAIVGDPPVVLLDQPSSNLDQQAELELRKLLTIIGKKRTVIVVTHSPVLLACCDDVVALVKGQISDVTSHKTIDTTGYENNKIGVKQDLPLAQIQKKVPKKQNKLVAVREVEASPEEYPTLTKSVDEKQKKQIKLNEDANNLTKSPNKKDGKL